MSNTLEMLCHSWFYKFFTVEAMFHQNVALSVSERPKGEGKGKEEEGKEESEILSEALTETEKKSQTPRIPGLIRGLGVCDFFHFCQSFTSNFPFSFPFPLDFSLALKKYSTFN